MATFLWKLFASSEWSSSCNHRHNDNESWLCPEWSGTGSHAIVIIISLVYVFIHLPECLICCFKTWRNRSLSLSPSLSPSPPPPSPVPSPSLPHPHPLIHSYILVSYCSQQTQWYNHTTVSVTAPPQSTEGTAGQGEVLEAKWRLSRREIRCLRGISGQHGRVESTSWQHQHYDAWHYAPAKVVAKQGTA